MMSAPSHPEIPAMNFDFSEDQKLLQKTARDYLDRECGLDVARSVLEGGATHSDALWKGVAEMGWLGVAVPESHGGAGFGQLELALIAHEIGRALAPIPFGPSVYLASEALLSAGSDAQKERWLPALASGERIGTFALSERPGPLRLDAIETTFADGRVTGTKLPVPDAEVAGLGVVVARTGSGGASGLALVLVDLGAAGVEARRVESIDPSRPLYRLELRGAPAELLGGEAVGAAGILGLLDRAAVLTAFEQVGGAERAFEITREFTLGRYAFGRPIASFQALKHRMADVYAALQLATSNAYYGAWALSSGDDALPVAACGARISACDAFDLAATEMIQMHGGVGYTWEYDCHLFYRRAKNLGLALGGAAEWRDRLVARLAS
jgi:alkylation response protein AidB-like acyl-CoA dehydrogenase